MEEEKLKDLVEQAKQGDSAAFGELYDFFFDRIYRYIFYRVGMEVDAEDLTEEVFLKALQAIKRFEWRGLPFSAWLFRIAHNSVTDHFRKKGRRPETVFEEEDVRMAETETAAEQYAAKVMQEQVQTAICQLTPDQQNVIILRFFAGFSNKEVASFLSKTEEAVKALQHRGLASLNRVLKGGSKDE